MGTVQHSSNVSVEESGNSQHNSNNLSEETVDYIATTNEGIEPSKRKESIPTVKPSKRMKKKDDPRLLQAYSVLDRIGTEPHDECSTFCEHLTIKLRKFNEPQRSILMHNINNLVFETEMELYNQNHQTVSNSNSYSGTPEFIDSIEDELIVCEEDNSQ